MASATVGVLIHSGSALPKKGGTKSPGCWSWIAVASFLEPTTELPSESSKNTAVSYHWIWCHHSCPKQLHICRSQQSNAPTAQTNRRNKLQNSSAGENPSSQAKILFVPNRCENPTSQCPNSPNQLPKQNPSKSLNLPQVFNPSTPSQLLFAPNLLPTSRWKPKGLMPQTIANSAPPTNQTPWQVKTQNLQGENPSNLRQNSICPQQTKPLMTQPADENPSNPKSGENPSN